MQIPEIAVTLASPQASTTDLFIQWVNEETEHAAYGNLKHFKEQNLSAFDHTIPDEYIELEKGPEVNFEDEKNAGKITNVPPRVVPILKKKIKL